MGLNDQVALVTGASRGIGRAIALELGRRGAKVVGTATTNQGAERITATFAEHGMTGQGMPLNVTDADSVDSVLKEVDSAFGAPVILVNNAAITRDNLLLRMKPEEWTDILETNLTSVFRLSKGVLRGMMKTRHGRIITIGSVVGETGNAGQTNYAAAKAGLGGFTRSLAREVGSRGVTVNLVCPGFIDTDMTAALSEPQRQALTDQIPLGRLGSPEDVAAAVGFLASAEGGYITGATIDVNGGMFMN